MNPNALHTKLNIYLKSHGLKSTKQRDLIVKTFFNWGDRHVSIEDLLAKVRKKNSHISYATVYRTLLLLVDAKLAHQQQFGKGHSRFEPCKQQHHDHLICSNCGKIIEFENDTIEELQKRIATKYRFKLNHHKMELYGICEDCQK